MANITICNRCGQHFSTYNGMSLHTQLGYGTIYDGSEFQLDICDECLDDFIGFLNHNLKIPVVTADE